MHAVNQPDVPPSARVAADTFTGKLCRPGTSMICVMPNGGRLWSWDWSMAGAPHEGARAIVKSFAQFLCKISDARSARGQSSLPIGRLPVAMFHRVYVSGCAPCAAVKSRAAVAACLGRQRLAMRRWLASFRDPAAATGRRPAPIRSACSLSAGFSRPVLFPGT